jgi:hypothetical protein
MMMQKADKVYDMRIATAQQRARPLHPGASSQSTLANTPRSPGRPAP